MLELAMGFQRVSGLALINYYWYFVFYGIAYLMAWIYQELKPNSTSVRNQRAYFLFFLFLNNGIDPKSF